MKGHKCAVPCFERHVYGLYFISFLKCLAVLIVAQSVEQLVIFHTGPYCDT